MTERSGNDQPFTTYFQEHLLPVVVPIDYLISMSETTGLSRRERERSRRRAAMLKAARTVFAEKGYRQATLEEIAQKAEFGKGTLYNYFEGGKEELLFAVLDQMYDSLCELAEEILAEKQFTKQPIRQVFYQYIESVIAHFMEQQELFMLLIKEAHRMAFDDKAEKVQYFCDQNNRIKQYLIPAIEHGIATDQLKKFPPLAIATIIGGNVNGYLMEACRPGTPTVAITAPDQAAEFLTTMLFDGLSTDG